MKRSELIQIIESKKSVLCVGLDPDIRKLPKSYGSNAKGLARVCKVIIESTADLAVG